MIRTICFTLLMSFGVSVCGQQTEQSHQSKQGHELDSVLAETIQDGQVPGIVAAAIRPDRPVAFGAAGLRKTGTDHSMTCQDKLHLGSCSKAMTATLMGVLVDEGRLDWSDTIGELLPAINDQIDEAYRTVTLWQLLTHRGGVIPNGAHWIGSGVATHDNRLKIVAMGLKSKPAKSKVGKYEYSNLGYLVAATMAEEVTGSTWEELIRRKVFKPLHMVSAGFGPPGTKESEEQPWGHQINSSGQLFASRMDNPPSLGPAATIHCTIADWAKFIALHLDIDCREHRLLTRETLSRLHTPPKDGMRPYAGGWLVRKNSDGTYQIAHDGSNTFWFSTVLANPQRGTADLVVNNLGSQAGQSTNQKAARGIRKLIK